jgi:antitoxin HicB
MKTVEDYLRLPYHIVLVRDEDEDGDVGYVASVEELPGCLSQGDTPAEAYESIRDAMFGWLTVAFEDGREIPLPVSHPTYNGKILVRAPRTLHSALAHAAESEGVSLNQFVVASLSAAVAWRAAPEGVTQFRGVAGRS